MINHTARHERRWAIILAAKGDRCNHCHQTYPAAVYDLHHPNGKTSRKETPSRIIRFATEAVFLRELALWELLCANCHRIHHANNGWYPGRVDRPRGNCVVCKKVIVSSAPRIFACPGECQQRYHAFLSRNCQRRSRSSKTKRVFP